MRLGDEGDLYWQQQHKKKKNVMQKKVVSTVVGREVQKDVGSALLMGVLQRIICCNNGVCCQYA